MEAAPGAMRFVQNNSLREIVEDAPSICERQFERNRPRGFSGRYRSWRNAGPA